MFGHYGNVPADPIRTKFDEFRTNCPSRTGDRLVAGANARDITLAAN